MRNKKGFTLVEIMIVIAIIGVVTAIAGWNISKTWARVSKDALDIQITKMVEAQYIFYGENGRFASNFMGGMDTWMDLGFKKDMYLLGNGSAYSFFTLPDSFFANDPQNHLIIGAMRHDGSKRYLYTTYNDTLQEL